MESLSDQRLIWGVILMTIFSSVEAAVTTEKQG